ncbi:MAG: hypothetical protein WC058_16105 [Phycisphaeraceae bacterium]
MTRKLLTIAMLLLVVGCLPIDLSVSSDGRVLIPRAEGFFTYNPATGELLKVTGSNDGEPAFGLFMPDGKSMILVTNQSEGGMGGQFTYKLRTPDGKSRDLHTASNTTYATVSPDGKYVAVARLSEQQTPGFNQNLPEITLVNIADGSAKPLVSNVISLHRWSPDGKSLLVVQLKSKSDKRDIYAGTLQLLNIADGSVKPLANVVGPQGAFFDLSPDGKQAVFTALLAAPSSAKDQPQLPAEGDDDNDNQRQATHLFTLDIAAGKLTQLRDDVKYVRFSPDGKHVLIAADESNGLAKLEVVDAAFKDSRLIASDAAVSAGGGGFGPGTDIYPTFLNNNTILYIAQRAVYGSSGKNMMLTTVSLDGATRKIHQPAIDAGILK